MRACRGGCYSTERSQHRVLVDVEDMLKYVFVDTCHEIVNLPPGLYSVDHRMLYFIGTVRN